MKRILFVLALMLALTVCFVGETFALNYPYGDIRNDDPDGGDDHPWGGDDIGPIAPIVSKYQRTSYATGIFAVDIFFRFIILEKSETISSRVPEKHTRSIRKVEFRKYSTLEEKGIRK